VTALLLSALLSVVTTPKIVSYVTSSSNQATSGTTDLDSATPRNDYRWYPPNLVGGGNCLLLALIFQRDAASYATGDSVTSIADTSGDTWSTTPVASVGNGSSGNSNMRIFLLPNAKAGEHRLTVTMSATQAIWRYHLFELFGTDCAVTGTSSNGNQTGGTITAGTLSPANNDAVGGNLIFAFFAQTGGGGQAPPTLWATSGGFTLLSADVSTKSDESQQPTATAYLVQTTAAAVTPTVTVTTPGADSYSGVAVALRAAPVGWDPANWTGIRVNSIQHFTNGLPPATWNFQVPSTGNMVVGVTPSASSCCLIISSVTDNKSNTWTATNNSDTEAPWIFYCTAPCTTGPDLVVTIHAGATHINSTVLFYDISGAATSGTVDGHPANANGNMSCTSSAPPADTTSTNTCPEDTFHSIAGFTPASVGMTLISCAYGTGPSRGFVDRNGNPVSAPAGAIWNYVWYTGITDFSRMDNSDCQAHLYNNDLSSQTWNFNLDWEYYSPANTGTSAFSHLIHIKGATVTPPTQTSTAVVQGTRGLRPGGR